MTYNPARSFWVNFTRQKFQTALVLLLQIFLFTNSSVQIFQVELGILSFEILQSFSKAATGRVP